LKSRSWHDSDYNYCSAVLLGKQTQNFEIPTFECPTFECPNFEYPNFKCPNFKCPNFQVRISGDGSHGCPPNGPGDGPPDGPHCCAGFLLIRSSSSLQQVRRLDKSLSGAVRFENRVALVAKDGATAISLYVA